MSGQNNFQSLPLFSQEPRIIAVGAHHPLNLNVAVELIYCPHFSPGIGPIHGCLLSKECFDFVNYTLKSVHCSFILSFLLIYHF